MSETNDIKVKATALKTFFNEKGHKVKHTECVEAVSRMQTGQCYNVAKNKAIRILKNGEKLTFKEMKSTNFNIEVVISIGLDIFLNGIEAVNEYASEAITGNEYALCDISYEVYPYIYGNYKYEVAILVTGYIEEIESLDHLEDYEELEEEE